MKYSIVTTQPAVKQSTISPSQLSLGEIAEIVAHGQCGREWIGGYCQRFPGYPGAYGETLCSLYRNGEYSWVQSDAGLRLRRLPPGTAITFTIKE